MGGWLTHPPAVLGNEQAPPLIPSLVSDFPTFVAQSSILFKASSHSHFTQRERESLTTQALLASCHLVSDRGQGLRVSSNLHAPRAAQSPASCPHLRICESTQETTKKGSKVLHVGFSPAFRSVSSIWSLSLFEWYWVPTLPIYVNSLCGVQRSVYTGPVLRIQRWKRRQWLHQVRSCVSS